MRALSHRSDRAIHRMASAMLVACAVFVGATTIVVVWPRVSTTLGIKSSAVREPVYKTGQRIDVPADWYQSSPYTVVLFARANCGACQTAQPFFKQLVSDLKGRASVVFVGHQQSTEEDADYGRTLGLRDSAIRTAPSGLKVRSTPTLVVINQRGEILAAWEGVGPEAQQKKIATAIQRALGV